MLEEEFLELEGVVDLKSLGFKIYYTNEDEADCETQSVRLTVKRCDECEKGILASKVCFKVFLQEKLKQSVICFNTQQHDFDHNISNVLSVAFLLGLITNDYLLLNNLEVQANDSYYDIDF